MRVTQVVENAVGRSGSRDANGSSVMVRQYLVTTPELRHTPSLVMADLPRVGNAFPDHPDWLVVDRDAEPTSNPLVWRVDLMFRRIGDPIPPEAFACMMQEIASSGDNVQSHIDADALLCVQLQLRLLGYGDAADRYDAIERWFE